MEDSKCFTISMLLLPERDSTACSLHKTNMQTYILESQDSFSESEKKNRDCCKQKRERKRGRRTAPVKVRFGGVTQVCHVDHHPPCQSRQHEGTACTYSRRTAETEAYSPNHHHPCQRRQHEGSTSQQTDQTETSPLWYTREEYAEFKKVLVGESREILRLHRAAESKNESGIASIRRAYTLITSCCEPQDTEHSMTLHDDEVLHLLQELNLPLHHGCSHLVGMEQWVSRTIQLDRTRRRHRLWEAVLDIQSENFGHWGPDATNDKLCYREDAMRLVCEEISRPACLFAQYLGMAS